MRFKNSGILIVDKPGDATSANVVARVKKLIGARKVGHAGALDPFATGVLVCCINSATKLAKFFLHGNRKYEAVLRLGIETDTQDFSGAITSTCEKIEFSEIKIQSVLKQFEGAIEQQPPIYSALKFKGVPLYKLARSGNPIQKPARRVYISKIKIVEIKLPFIRFVVSCSGGTYIRTLCSDIGAALGCGGHLKELNRIESSGFTINDAITLPEIEKLTVSEKLSYRIVSMTDALKDMPKYMADKALAEKIMYGKIITQRDFITEHVNNQNGFVKIVDTNNSLVAVIEHSKERHRYNYCCVFNN